MPLNRNRRCILQLDDESYEGFQIQFDVTKTVKKAPRNKARISIYNVSEAVYDKAVKRNRELVVRLYAGYGLPGLVFIGNPVKNGVSFEWTGASKILTIEAQDGYRAYQRSRVSFTLDADKVTMRDLVSHAASSMGLPVDVVDLDESEFEQELTQGTALYGPASAILDRVAAATGADWSIQNGKLQVLPRRKVRSTQGPLYSSDLHNIQEFPKFTDEGIKLKTFMDSSIIPGDRFQLKVNDPKYDGIYKAHTVVHSGSLWDGGPWTTEVQGRVWTETAVAAPIPPVEFLNAGAYVASTPEIQRAIDESPWNMNKRQSE